MLQLVQTDIPIGRTVYLALYRVGESSLLAVILGFRNYASGIAEVGAMLLAFLLYSEKLANTLAPVGLGFVLLGYVISARSERSWPKSEMTWGWSKARMARAGKSRAGETRPVMPEGDPEQ